MLEVKLRRYTQGDGGTFSDLVGPLGFQCAAGELPYRDLDGDGKRDSKRSRIIPGRYRVSWFKSPTRKNPNGSPEYTYRLEDVPDADGVLIHMGNFCGDITKGYISDVEGCIILGRAVLDILITDKIRLKHPGFERKSQIGVTSSWDTMQAFVAHMEKKPFMLTIEEAFK